MIKLKRKKFDDQNVKIKILRTKLKIKYQQWSEQVNVRGKIIAIVLNNNLFKLLINFVLKNT